VAGPIRVPQPKPIDETTLRLWLNQVWRESVSLNDLRAYPARAYFERRRVKKAAMSACDLRFHCALNYVGADGGVLGTYGAVLALVRNNAGEPVSIHRTFITKSGLKVDFLGRKNKARKLPPSVNKHNKAHQIRLIQQPQGVLRIEEGLDTAIAVTQKKSHPVRPK